MWARVKFLLDGQVVNRPISYFKDCDSVQAELKKKTVREQYSVFWSPTDKEGPTDVLQREGRILDIDSILFATDDVPVAGYYKATIQNYADSKEDLLKLLETPQSRRFVKATVKTAQGKIDKHQMKRKATINVKAAAQHNKKLFKVGESADKPEKRKEVVRSEDETDEDDPLSTLNETCDPGVNTNQGSKSKKPRSANVISNSLTHAPSSDSNGGISDEDDVPYCQYKDKLEEIEKLKEKIKKDKIVAQEAEKQCKEAQEEIKKLREVIETQRRIIEEISFGQRPGESSQENPKKEIEKLKKMLSVQEDELEEYRSLNRSWQRAVLKLESKLQTAKQSRSEHGKPSDPHKQKNIERKEPMIAAPHGNFDEGNNSKSSPSNLPKSGDTLSGKGPTTTEITVDTDNATDVVLHEMNDARTVDFVANDISTEIPMESATESPLEIPTAEEELGIRGGVEPITEEQFKMCLVQGMKHKEKALGDPMFVKNVAECLWTKEELLQRSAAGKAASTSKKAPRKECTPIKRKYCADLLRRRIKLQEPSASETEISKRVSDKAIKKYIGDKIKSCRRAAGLKDDPDD